MQLIDFALAGGVLELPHPLLADDVNLHRIFRRPRLRKVNLRAPNEHAQGDQQRNHGPERLEFCRAFDGPGNLERVAAAIADDEEDHDR